MVSKLKLIRLPNLLIVALTMYLVRYCILIQYMNYGYAIRKEWIPFTLDGFEFFLLVLSTGLITAGGYVINDFFDVNIDEVNKPERVIVGHSLTKKKAYTFYGMLSLSGIVISGFVAASSGNIRLCLISVLSVGLLWFYSSMFKKMTLIGNIVVALLSCLVPLIVGLYEPKIYNSGSGVGNLVDFHVMGVHLSINAYAGYILGYSLFAFLISLAREIIKDVEDIKGDSEFGCRTLPIVAGIKASKIIVSGILIFIMYFLAKLQILQYESKDAMSFWYFMIMVQIPIAILIIYFSFIANNQKRYRIAVMIAKVIMLTGVLSMLVFYLSLPQSIPLH